MLIQSICLLVLILALCVVTVRRDDLKRPKPVLTVFVLLYVGVLLWFTLLRSEGNLTLTSFIPFRSFWRITQVRWHGNGEYIFRAVVGNMLLFVPVGLLTAGNKRTRHPFLVAGLAGFVVSLLVETAQLILVLGTFETDDVICNTWGALIGCSAALFLHSRGEPIRRRLRLLLPLFLFAGVLAAVCIVPVIREITYL